MSGMHTAGQLIVGTDIVCEDPFPETPLYARGGAAAVAVAIEFANCPGMRRANAKRLAACWNACDGLSTENLESNLPIKDGLRGLNAQLRAARALLAEVVKPHVDHAAEVMATGKQPAINPLAVRIHDFLKGGAT